MNNELMINALRTVAQLRPDRLTECQTIINRIERGNAELAAKKARLLIRETLDVIDTDAQERAELEAVILDCDFGYHRTEPPTVGEILYRAGMTHAQLSERFGIPIRTIDDWCRGARKPPEYVVRMMIEILFGDRI